MIKFRTYPWYNKMIHQGEQVYVADRYKRYEAKCADAKQCTYTYTVAKTPTIKGQKPVIESTIDGDLVFQGSHLKSTNSAVYLILNRRIVIKPMKYTEDVMHFKLSHPQLAIGEYSVYVQIKGLGEAKFEGLEKPPMLKIKGQDMQIKEFSGSIYGNIIELKGKGFNSKTMAVVYNEKMTAKNKCIIKPSTQNMEMQCPVLNSGTSDPVVNVIKVIQAEKELYSFKYFGYKKYSQHF